MVVMAAAVVVVLVASSVDEIGQYVLWSLLYCLLGPMRVSWL